MRFLKFLLLLPVIIFPLIVFSANQTTGSTFAGTQSLPKEEVIKAFKYYKKIIPNATVTAVTDVSLTNDFFSLPVFAVYDLNTNSFEPYLYTEKKSSLDTSARLRTNLSFSEGSPVFLNDGNLGTYYEFPIRPNYSGNSAQIVFSYDRPIRSSSLLVNFSQNVINPQKVSIAALVNGKEKIVLAPSVYYGKNISFPETVSDYWVIIFEHTQPLRISEIKFADLDATQLVTKNLRFLVQPGHEYLLYFDADRQIRATTKEAGDLAHAEKIIYPSFSGPFDNPGYQLADTDADGIADINDNCINIFNPDQKDEDNNGHGDLCEDYDNDEILNSKDNCPQIPNRTQIDTDDDDTGDACDTLDNRITERMPWLPWAGIAVAGIVVLGLFVIALRHKKENTQ
jgi:hypothetical protein